MNHKPNMLTPAQTAALCWVLHGKSLVEISQLMGKDPDILRDELRQAADLLRNKLEEEPPENVNTRHD